MNLLDLVEKIESLEKQINNNYAQIQGIFLREERTKEEIEDIKSRQESSQIHTLKSIEMRVKETEREIILLKSQQESNHKEIVYNQNERSKNWGNLEKIEELEVEIKKVDEENLLRVGSWRESCIEMIHNKFYDLSEKLEDISSFKERENEPLTLLKEVIKEITDTERLDFLEKNNLFVHPKKYSSLDKWCVYPSQVSGTQGILPNGNRDTLREAIDAAMRGKDGE